MAVAARGGVEASLVTLSCLCCWSPTLVSPRGTEHLESCRRLMHVDTSSTSTFVFRSREVAEKTCPSRYATTTATSTCVTVLARLAGRPASQPGHPAGPPWTKVFQPLFSQARKTTPRVSDQPLDCTGYQHGTVTGCL